MKRNVSILLLAVCTMAAGAWARQENGVADVEDVKTIDVVASRFQFEPATITVAQGDSVRLRLHFRGPYSRPRDQSVREYSRVP